MNVMPRDGVSAEEPSARDGVTVYAVIPVFNRLDRTLRCIECLKAQTFQPIRIIVSDGRSTDGSPRAIAERHPDVVVLTTWTVLWWAGSMRRGIDWALTNSSRDDDFVMMVNNDTEFEPGYVESLVSVAQARNLAVGGIVVDESDPDNIIDSGVQFDWEKYAFIGRHARPQEPFDPVQSTDVLPGRGTIIPIGAIRRAGNVDDVAFPHYLADYEFTYRLRTQGGIGLAVSFDAVIRTEPAIPRPRPVRHPLAEAWALFRQRFSKSSKSNLLVHWRFISRHAPPEMKARLRSRMFYGTIRSVVTPVLKRARTAPAMRPVVGVVVRAKRLNRILHRIILNPYLIHASDMAHLNLDPAELERDEIIRKMHFGGGFVGFWRFNHRRSYLKIHHPQALALHRRVSNPIRLLSRAASFCKLTSRNRSSTLP